MLKPKFSLTAILSTTAIATGILFGSASWARPCHLSNHATSTQQAEQDKWLRSPLVAAITLPGIALAVSLYVRGRSYQG